MRVDAATAQNLLAEDPSLPASLSPEERLLPLQAARDGRAAALKLMGRLGLDLDVEGDTGERPLHWAAWYGQAESVRVLLAAGVKIDVCDNRFRAPPTGWCHHGSTTCRNPSGDYAAVMEHLIAAGAMVPENDGASPEVMAVLQRHRRLKKR